jgi:hypothetical protein
MWASQVWEEELVAPRPLAVALGGGDDDVDY